MYYEKCYVQLVEMKNSEWVVEKEKVTAKHSLNVNFSYFDLFVKNL